MCYAALVHEYFVTLTMVESVCYAALVQSTLLSYYGGECVLCCSGA